MPVLSLGLKPAGGSTLKKVILSGIDKNEPIFNFFIFSAIQTYICRNNYEFNCGLAGEIENTF